MIMQVIDIIGDKDRVSFS